MSKKDKRVDAYIAKSADFAKPILRHLRELVHETCPGVQEAIKWNFPCFDYKGIMCSMASFKAHCSFGFWKAPLMKDYAKTMSTMGNPAMGNFGRISSLKDLPPDKVLIKLIEDACQLNESGVKLARPKAGAKKPLTIPAYFKKALNGNSKARATFDAFPPSHKQDYVEWITEAKTDETRSRRMETTLAWLSEGKSRNWKYEKRQR